MQNVCLVILAGSRRQRWRIIKSQPNPPEAKENWNGICCAGATLFAAFFYNQRFANYVTHLSRIKVKNQSIKKVGEARAWNKNQDRTEWLAHRCSLTVENCWLAGQKLWKRTDRLPLSPTKSIWADDSTQVDQAIREEFSRPTDRDDREQTQQEFIPYVSFVQASNCVG